MEETRECTVKYTRVLLIDREPTADHDYVQNIAEDSAGLDREEINGQPLGVLKRQEIRHLKIYTLPHEYRFFAKVEAKVGSDVLCSVVSMLNKEFKRELKNATDGEFSEAVEALIARFPAHVRRGIPYIERGVATNTKIRFDRKGLIHSASDLETPAQKESKNPAPKGPKKQQGQNRTQFEKKEDSKLNRQPKGRRKLQGNFESSRPMSDILSEEESNKESNADSDSESLEESNDEDETNQRQPSESGDCGNLSNNYRF